MQSEASACNVPYHRCGVAAGESRTNTVPKKRRNDKKSKKSVSLISDTCGCGKMSQPYSCGINAMRKEVLCFIKLNIKKERIRKWRRSSGCYFRNRDWQSGKSRSVYAMKCWILCWENRLPCVMQG